MLAVIFILTYLKAVISFLGFPAGSVGKESACNAGDLGSIPRLGRSPEGGHGNLLQYSCLENPHGQRSLAGYSPWVCKESGWRTKYRHKYNRSSLLSQVAVQVWCGISKVSASIYFCIIGQPFGVWLMFSWSRWCSTSLCFSQLNPVRGKGRERKGVPPFLMGRTW